MAKARTITVNDLSKDGALSIRKHPDGKTLINFSFNRLSAGKTIDEMNDGNLSKIVDEAELPQEVTAALTVIRDYLYNEALKAEGMTEEEIK